MRVGQQRVQPHSKTILRDAIKSDTEFLSKSNIMDYSYVSSLPFVSIGMKFSLIFTNFFSLLLGVDKEKKQIARGQRNRLLVVL